MKLLPKEVSNGRGSPESVSNVGIEVLLVVVLLSVDSLLFKT